MRGWTERDGEKAVEACPVEIPYLTPSTYTEDQTGQEVKIYSWLKMQSRKGRKGSLNLLTMNRTGEGRTKTGKENPPETTVVGREKKGKPQNGDKYLYVSW